MDSREPSPDTNEYLDLSLLSEQSALYAVDGPEEELEGVVDRIVYENTENGFFVGRLRESDMGPLVTFVGNLMAVSPGETVRLKGRWVEDKRFGRQFRAAAAEVVLPTSAAGIERYLGSGLIPGIGPTYAKRLVDAFGVETLKVIGEQPERLRRGGRSAAHYRHAVSCAAFVPAMKPCTCPLPSPCLLKPPTASPPA